MNNNPSLAYVKPIIFPVFISLSKVNPTTSAAAARYIGVKFKKERKNKYSITENICPFLLNFHNFSPLSLIVFHVTSIPLINDPRYKSRIHYHNKSSNFFSKFDSYFERVPCFTLYNPFPLHILFRVLFILPCHNQKIKSVTMRMPVSIIPGVLD